MISDGYIIGDGSWELRIYVTDLQVERTIRVKGDLHIGGVMFKLVEDLGMYIFHSLVTVAFVGSRKEIKTTFSSRLISRTIFNKH